MATHTLLYKTKSVRLDPNEALLAQKLAQRFPAIVQHDVLIGHIWDRDEPGDAGNCLKQHVYHLRRKLNLIGLDVENFFKVGYRLVQL